MTIPGIYSQRDARWGNLELGYNTDPNYSIYHYGCLITAIANMLWWNGNNESNPGSINSWLLNNGGFEQGGGLVIWSTLQPLLDQVQMVSHGYTTDLNAVNSFLQDDNNYAIAQLTKPGFPMHFCAMPYVGMIADSWDGILKPVTSYSFVGAHLYSKVLPAPAPAPVAPPVVAPAPQPPIVAPTPAPLLPLTSEQKTALASEGTTPVVATPQPTPAVSPLPKPFMPLKPVTIKKPSFWDNLIFGIWKVIKWVFQKP